MAKAKATLSATNLFALATPLPGKPKKGEKKEVYIAGLEAVAAFDAVIKAATAVQTTLAKTLKDTTVIGQFIVDGIAKGGKPENFRGVEGHASASVELRKRTSTSGLTDADIEIVNKYGLGDQLVETTDVTETFVINPAYINDQDLLAKVSAALSEIPDLPGDFIQKQTGNKKVTVGEDAIDTAFKKVKDVAALSTLLGIFGTLALKPKLDTDDLNVALDIVGPIMMGTNDNADPE